ncbi:MAG: FG-GAP repeat protein [Planctomycetes bacterium]|nr:FG-GAP repeat protein [Planctomycetota bacterium]
MYSRFAVILPLFALALLAPAPGQVVGGSFDTIFQFDGENTSYSFGTSVSDAGDVNADGFDDVIIGAYSAYNNNLANSGAAYVYSGKDGSLLHQFNGAAKYDQLGFSVSGAGDVNGDGFDYLLVGAHGAAPGSIGQAGTVYVFSGSNGAILQQWNGTSYQQSLGYSVSGAGDVNADGYDDVVVGAPGSDPGGRVGAGSAFVFSGVDGSLLYELGGVDPGDGFGYAVSGGGDVNADGYADVIGGTWRATFGGVTQSGMASVFSGANGALLYAWGGGYASWFGVSVSDAGDLNADGYDDVMVGSTGADPGNRYEAGSVYAYSGANGSLLYQWDGVSEDDVFGTSVSSAGDMDGDGYDDVVIGAAFTSPGGLQYAGSAYVYSGANGSLMHQWDGAADNDVFGQSVSSAGDTNQDGLPEVLVCAYQADPGGLSDAGSAYIFGFNPYLLANTSSISASQGGTLEFDLNFPLEAASKEYKVLISQSGIGPTYYGVNIPLTQDSLVIDTFFGNYPVPIYSDLHGTLNADGNASASLTIPAGIPSSLIGNTYYLAAIANSLGNLPEHSSIAKTVTIVP